MNTEQWIDAYREEYLSNCRDLFRHVLRRTGSPIEQVMVAYLFANGFTPPDMHEWSRIHDRLPLLGVKKNKNILTSPGDSMAVVTQPTIAFDGYVVTPDFGLIDACLLDGELPVAIAVELDGHAFHERTKEQAARDKKRDRALLSKGWTVVRYTGSEVVKDPFDVFESWNTIFASEAKKRGRP